MQFWVYLLRCNDGSYYAGHTDDLEARLWQHNEGKGGDWTRRRRPVELVWCADVPTRYEALEFERRVKNWSRAQKEALIAGDWARIGYLAKPPHERPSTSLGTNEVGEEQSPTQVDLLVPCNPSDPFVPSEVKGCAASLGASPGPSRMREGGE
ncbi:MAG: GIY-YIG nuclease family protein [Allosphingosinicella sp.]